MITTAGCSWMCAPIAQVSEPCSQELSYFRHARLCSKSALHNCRDPFARAVQGCISLPHVLGHIRMTAKKLTGNTNGNPGIAAQVCGVFALLLSGVHTWMYWGLYCYPWLRSSFIAAYYLAAAGCVVAGLRARTQIQRAAPMLALLGVRLGSLLTRTVLNSGSQDAVWHYAVTEVRPPSTPHWGHL